MVLTTLNGRLMFQFYRIVQMQIVRERGVGGQAGIDGIIGFPPFFLWEKDWG